MKTLRTLDRQLAREARASLDRMARLIFGKRFDECGDSGKQAVLFFMNIAFAHQGIPIQIELDKK